MRQSSLQTNTTQADALSSPGWCYSDAGFHCETLPCNKQGQIIQSRIAHLQQLHITLFHLMTSWKFYVQFTSMDRVQETFQNSVLLAVNRSLILLKLNRFHSKIF